MSVQFLSFDRIRRIVGLGLITFLVLLVPPAVQADTADVTSSPTVQADTVDVISSPPDRTTSSRPAVADDRPIRPLAAIKPDFFQKEVTNSAGNGEPSLAVNPNNTQQIVATTFAGSWGASATLFFSQDGGGTWTAEATVPQPPGIAAAFLTNVPCPCDQTVEYGRDGRLYGTFLLADNGTPAKSNVVTGSTTDPTQAAAWSWNTPGGVTQLTNAAHQNNADQPWLIVTRDPTNAAQDNVYVGYDDFNGSPDARVAVSKGASPVNITTDAKAGTESPSATNPGLRLTADPRNGAVYAVYEQSSGSTQPKSVTYKLNRSTDGGTTWTLNGSSDGLTVDSVKSDQAPGFKFGTVNALLGGVDHAAVDPTNGDVYVVYGVDNGAGGNNLQLRRLTDNGAGGLNVGPALAVTAATANAALPSIAVGSDRTIAILYDTFDGMSSGTPSLPKFSAHLARSSNQGATFSDEVLLSFLSPRAANNAAPRQRVLGDYQQIKSVGATFFGVFSANTAAFGATTANTDAVFFRTLTPTTLTIDGATTGDFNDPVTVSATLRAAGTNAPIPNQLVSFTLNGAETCSATTLASGQASCSITPGEAAGTYTLTATFNSTLQFQGFTTSTNFIVTKEDTKLSSQTSLQVFIVGATATLSSTLVDSANAAEGEASDVPIANPVSSDTGPVPTNVTMTLGSGAGSQSCTAPTNASGVATCSFTVSSSVGNGFLTITDSFTDSTNHFASATNTQKALVAAFPDHGSFEIGDVTEDSASLTGALVNWWGPSHWKTSNNSFSALPAGETTEPSQMKGFIETPASFPPTCGTAWTSDPGNSSNPPATVPAYMATIVASNVGANGSVITGNTVEIVVIQTNLPSDEYAPGVGNAGTGPIVAEVCPSNGPPK